MTFEDDSTAPLIRSDAGKLRQIFTNLIANAVKFTERGSITARLLHDAEKRTVSVEIGDTGMASRRTISAASSSRFIKPKSPVPPTIPGAASGFRSSNDSWNI